MFSNYPRTGISGIRIIVLWQTRACETYPKRREGFGAGMRTERGSEGEKERDRGREADRERGTQGSFHGLPWRAGGAPIAAVRLGQKLAWDEEREGVKSTLPYVC